MSPPKVPKGEETEAQKGQGPVWSTQQNSQNPDTVPWGRLSHKVGTLSPRSASHQLAEWSGQASAFLSLTALL